ncbi:MAG: hypothetical protein IJR93_03355 [Treponema sp.]|nr:hypothetical protein [Treponema sp.]
MKKTFIAVLAAAILGGFHAVAQESKAPAAEPRQYPRVPNKIKPISTTLSIDLPFAFDEIFVSEEIPDDMKGWISSSKRCQADEVGVTVFITCVQYTNDFMRNYITGNEDAGMMSYLQGSMVDRMKEMEKNGQISAFSHRIMDIKLTGSKDNALLLKGRYRESTQDFEVWMLQILHKKEVWQVLFFFDPKDVYMQDAVEAACFSSVIK